MTKQDLARRISTEAGLSATDAVSALDATFEVITAELAAGGGVAVAGFGKFSVSDRAAREGRNPSDRRGDPDQGQQGREVLAGQRPEDSPQGLTAAVRLRRCAEPRAWPQAGQPARHSSARSERGRRGKIRELDRALQALAARAEQPGVNVVDVQLVVSSALATVSQP
jgi:DNA-binding protein HU-beta